MSMQTSLEGDPGKMAYLRNPNWTPTPHEHLRGVKVMPGTCERCVFGTGLHTVDCVSPSAPWDASSRMLQAALRRINR
jgi:hypothetical protein